jgi:Flp pilus assembly protein TadG
MRRRRQRDDGAVVVEAALILPILLMLVFGIIEFGMLFRANTTVSQAARAGARTAVALPRVPGYQTFASNAVGGALSTTMGSDEITYLTIYKANKTTGLPADGGTYKTCTECYRFTWDKPTKTWTQLSGPAWVHTAQKACGSEALTDYLGVYVEAKYSWITGFFTPFFGSTSTVGERTVMRLEPISTQSSCS